MHCLGGLGFLPRRMLVQSSWSLLTRSDLYFTQQGRLVLFTHVWPGCRPASDGHHTKGKLFCALYGTEPSKSFGSLDHELQPKTDPYNSMGSHHRPEANLQLYIQSKDSAPAKLVKGLLWTILLVRGSHIREAALFPRSRRGLVRGPAWPVHFARRVFGGFLVPCRYRAPPCWTTR